MISYLFGKNKLLFAFFTYLLIAFSPFMASQPKDLLVIDKLVKSCYRDMKLCNKALIKINNYQKIAAFNKNFPCQTRLLGLEANLIMAMNSNFKIKEAKNIIETIKKYC